MPTVLRVGPYRFFFYASDRHEPPHVHVERDEKVAKFWLRPVRLERSGRVFQARNQSNPEIGREGCGGFAKELE